MGSSGKSLIEFLLMKEKSAETINLQSLMIRRSKFSSSHVQMNNIRCRRIPMKRRARLDRSMTMRTRPRNSTTERKVRILKKLVPNCESTESVERVFMETADYIMALQMRVQVMQIMVDLLSAAGSNDHDQ